MVDTCKCVIFNDQAPENMVKAESVISLAYHGLPDHLKKYY